MDPQSPFAIANRRCGRTEYCEERQSGVPKLNRCSWGDAEKVGRALLIGRDFYIPGASVNYENAGIRAGGVVCEILARDTPPDVQFKRPFGNFAEIFGREAGNDVSETIDF